MSILTRSFIRTGHGGLFALALLVLFFTGCQKNSETASSPEKDADTPESAAAAPEMNASSDPVARVDGAVITRKEIDAAVNQMLSRWGGQIPAEEIEQVRDQVARGILEQFIQRQLLLNASQEAGLEISEEEIQKMRAEIEASLPEGTTLAESLSQQGLSEEDLIDGITKDLSIKKLLDQRLSDLPSATEEEARAFYDENPDEFEVPETAQARHILVAFGDDDSEERREALRVRAERIRRNLVEGADFAEIAAEHSDCPSKERGGNLGRFRRGQMVPAFEEAAFTQPLNEIGPLVETQFGYHIIQVTHRDKGGTLSFEDVKERVAQNLDNEQRQEAVMAYLQELRRQADIRYEDKAYQPVSDSEPES